MESCFYLIDLNILIILVIFLILLHLLFDLGPDYTFSDIHRRYLGFQVYYLRFYVADFIITLLLINNLFIFFAIHLELTVDLLKFLTCAFVLTICLIKLLDQPITFFLSILDRPHFILILLIQFCFFFRNLL